MFHNITFNFVFTWENHDISSDSFDFVAAIDKLQTTAIGNSGN